MKAHLTLTSWVGAVPGASHYNGRLRIGKEEIDLEYELTAAEAKKHNQDARRIGDNFRWKAGMTSSRFFTEEAVRAAAVAELKKHPEVTVLYEGSACVLDPQPVILGPEPLRTEMNAIYAEAEANDFWEGDEARMEDISKRWSALAKRIE